MKTVMAPFLRKPSTSPHDYLTGESQDQDWWMGQVIQCGGAARDPKVHNLF